MIELKYSYVPVEFLDLTKLPTFSGDAYAFIRTWRAHKTAQMGTPENFDGFLEYNSLLILS
jgi:hypothetical protein